MWIDLHFLVFGYVLGDERNSKKKSIKKYTLREDMWNDELTLLLLLLLLLLYIYRN
jgi:hypothetical protein